MLTDVRVRHPEMSEEQSVKVQDVINLIGRMTNAAERNPGVDPQEIAGQFNQQLSNAQESLTEVESQLRQSH